MALWHWNELCTALHLPEVSGPDIEGITIDSRLARTGDLFVALTGDPGPRFNASYRSNRDGHDFIDAARAQGAAGALVHLAPSADQIRHEQQRFGSVMPRLQVNDTLDSLWALGRAGRARLTCPVVAVTGSSGKTTCKTLLAAALNAFATEGSLNNHLGVPLSLARTPRDATAAIYEIGTNHPGEIGPLAELARPDVAVVLNVHPAHREHFVDMNALLQEKLSIHRGLGVGGHLVLEASLDASSLPEGLAISRFGRDPGADVQLLDVSGTTARYRMADRELAAQVPGGGEHRALTLAAVLCVLQVLGIDPACASQLSESLVPAGRGRRHVVGEITLIDDSYNANPESMAAALKALAGEPAGRRLALLGEMLELGAEGVAWHRDLAPLCTDLDAVFCVGEGIRPLADTLQAAATTPVSWSPEADAALLNRLCATLAPGDVLLVKGSNRVFWVRGTVGELLGRLAVATVGRGEPVGSSN